MSAINLYDLANIEVVSARAQEAIKKQAVLLNAKLKARQNGEVHIKNINNWSMWLTGANDTNQPDALRIRLLTLLVDVAKLNPVPTPAVLGFVQPIASIEISSVPFSQITGNPESNMALNAKFNTYLPLSAGTTKPLTGALYFASDELGVDVINEGDTLNIGASAGIVQFGADAEVKLHVVTEGAWQADSIGVAYGGLADIDFAGATDGQAVVKSGAGYAFHTIPAIPSLTGYIKADGTVPMTADLRFPISKGIDTEAEGTLYIGQNNATAVQIFQNLSVTNVVSGNWQASPVGLEFGGTGANLAPPSNPSFFIYASGTSAFAEIGANLRINAGAVTLTEILTGVKYEGSVIETGYGGTGLSTVGADGEVLTIVSGAPAWAAFSALTNPMNDSGQMIYGGAAGIPTRLVSNATSTNKFLRSVSSGNPSWEILLAADIPNIDITQVTGLSTALSNKLGTTLASGKMFVGNGSGAAAPVLMSGDATLSNTGALTIANSAVTFAKIQNATVQYALIGRWSAGSGVFQEVTIDGVTITIDAFGVMSSTGGGGISSLNGLTASSQTFAAIGTSGTAPAWTSSGSAHTLDIPLASASSVTAGLISKTEYDTFNGKQSALSGTGYSKWSGSTPFYLTATQVTADLNVFTTSLQGLVPASGGGTTNFLRADGTWAVPAGGGSGVTTVGTFSGSSQTNGASISSTTITFGPADATNPGMVTTGTQTLAGAKTFSGAMTINPTASLTTAQLTFGSLTNNWISFSTAGNAVPSLTNRSVGTKVVLYASLSGSALDYAIGTGVSTMWLSLGSSGDIFHIYAPISSVVTSVFSINPTTSIAYNGSAMTYGTNTTSTNVTGSAATGIFSRNFINLGTGGGTAGPVTVGSSFSSRSLGTRLIIQSASATSDADMAIGFNTNTFWQSVITSSYSFAWYAGAGSTGGTAATHLMNLSGTGVLNLVQSAGKLQIAGTQVVGPRDTGWTAFTGATNKATSYDTATVTLVPLAERVAAIQAALTTHGLIGA